VLDKLQSKAQSEQLEGMAKYGITVEQRLGVSVIIALSPFLGIGKLENYPGITYLLTFYPTFS